ncbi:aminotransferase-like domain-containing protein [Streptomyces sp. NPDC002248]
MQERSSVGKLADLLRAEFDRYPPGGKLPSSRELVARHRVGPVTVSRALARLAAEGLLVTRPGAGAYRAGRAAPAAEGDTSWQHLALSAESAEGLPRAVDASGVLATLAEPPAGVVEFNGGYLHPDLRPERALAAALARAGRRPGAWGRPPAEGLPELRAWFARDLAADGGGGPGPGGALVSPGGQSALSGVLRALAPPGAPVLVESPTYPGLLAVLRAAGQRPVPVPVDADGLRTDLLPEAFRVSGARVLVCQPLHQNPTGTVLAPARRPGLLAAARAAGAFVVEDDFARRLGHADAGPPPPPLAAEDPDGIVVHIRSLTKVTAPSLRVAAVLARGPVLERLRAVQVVDHFFVPRPLQEAALELVGSPSWPRHLRSVAGELGARRAALAAALARRLPEAAPARVPTGGYHLWLPLPEGTDESALAVEALRRGVAVAPGRPYHPAEPDRPHLRISYGGVADGDELEEGVRRLAEAFAAVRG